MQWIDGWMNGMDRMLVYRLVCSGISHKGLHHHSYPSHVHIAVGVGEHSPPALQLVSVVKRVILERGVIAYGKIYVYMYSKRNDIYRNEEIDVSRLNL